MTPEQIEGGRFCLPEREVRYWPSNQWEMTRQKESNVDTEARKIGEIEEETNQVSSESDNRKLNLFFFSDMIECLLLTTINTVKVDVMKCHHYC